MTVSNATFTEMEEINCGEDDRIEIRRKAINDLNRNVLLLS